MANAESFCECFFSLLQTLAKPLSNTLAMMCWALLTRENNRFWEGVVQPVAHAVSKAMGFLIDWTVVRSSYSDYSGASRN